MPTPWPKPVTVKRKLLPVYSKVNAVERRENRLRSSVPLSFSPPRTAEATLPLSSCVISPIRSLSSLVKSASGRA